MTMLLQRCPCRDHDGHDKRPSVATSLAFGRDFMPRQSLLKTKSFYVTTKYFYVATELAKVKRIYVVT